MKFNFALVVSLSLASFAAFAQDAPNPDVYKDKEALKKWESGESKFPPRPKNMPQVAIHAGHFMYAGDVTPRAGYGFGLSIEKALGYVFSLRLDGMYGEAKGLNYKPLAVGQMAANPVISKVTGYNAANRYYVKYRSDYYAASLQGVVHLGNLLFNGPPTKWGAYAYGGLGVNIYDTYYDLLKGTDPSAISQLQDYSKLTAEDVSTTSGRDKRLNDLLGAMPGETRADYETHAPADNSEVDFLFPNRGKSQKPSSNIMLPIGAGITYNLSKRVAVSLEHQVTFADDDLMDGQQWLATGSVTPNRDIPHYTNIRLAFNIGNFAKQTGPLWNLNPLDAPFAAVQKNNIKNENGLKDDDDDGVINMLDKEPNTPKEAPVDTRGRALDSDNDGVKDYADREPFTAPGMPVDKDGIGTGKLTNIDCSVCGSNSVWFLPSTHFDNDSYCIKGEYYADLKNVATVLAKNPKICIAVKGFTDDSRTGDYNQGLSYNRAKAVADFLVNNYNVDRNRVSVKIGGTDAITKTATASSFANRRVEIEVVPCGTASDSAPTSAATSGTATCAPAPQPFVYPTPGPIISTPEIPVRANKGMIKR